ncbi:MAG: hypothetical protein AAF542_25520, partial [Pseudomonadota bacterium]
MRVSGRRLGLSNDEPPRTNKDTITRILTQQEVLEGYTAFGKHLTFDFIESAFSRGDICNGVLVDGQWVGF